MKKLTVNEYIAVAIGVLLIAYFMFYGSFSLPLQSTNNIQQNMNQDINSSSNQQDNSNVSGGVTVSDTVVGTGPVAEAGKTVYVNYTGTFTNGKVFDSSYSRGVPIDFILGNGDVIPGWEKGIQGMKVGGKRRLVISPEEAYGPNDIKDPRTGQVIIPGNSTLIFEVELMEVK